MQIGHEECHTLGAALAREWLETDHAGGYASNTILFCPTRRYHGLLVAPFPGNRKRHLFLARFEETLHREDKHFAISIARYPGQFSPMGHQSLERFELRPYPSCLFRIGRAEIWREVLLVRGQPLSLVRYHIATPRTDIELRLRPLLPCREADQLTFENLALNPRAQRIRGGIVFRPYPALPPVQMTVHGADVEFVADPVWYRRLEYLEDLARGYPGHEDQFSPGVFHVRVPPGQDVVVATTIGEPPADNVKLWREESTRRRRELQGLEPAPRARLAHAAGAFLWRAGAHGHPRVMAGFPWLYEWGRDSCVALPGLLLSRGERESVALCGEALEGALRFLDDGLLPDRIGAGPADSAYESIDASLWWVRAVRLWQQAGGDPSRLRERFVPALLAIAESHVAGAGPRHLALELTCAEGGLLHAGPAGAAATWMSSKTADGPVVPRDGYAVEVNALWYFLLQYLETLFHELGKAADERLWTKRRRLVGRTFLQRFWLEDERCLADRYVGGRADRSIRPNMVIAAALEWSPLSRSKRIDVVQRAAAQLLTPRGLRSLDPEDPRYVGRYGGDQAERDRACHQGTVWPWLLGFHVEAHLRAFGREPESVAGLRAVLEGFEEHRSGQGMNHIAEVFDGDPPHRPGGGFAQAWNTGEILRAFALLDGGVACGS